jgi:Family of unknown function (DUF5695)
MMKKIVKRVLFVVGVGLLSVHFAYAQQQQPSPTPLPPTLGLEQGYLEFDTPDFKVKLVKASQTIAALQPKAADGFDFTPADRLERRAANGYHHLGDLTLRLRTGNTGPWQKYDTAEARKPVQALPPPAGVLAVSDLAATLPADIPVQITRSWLLENGRLVLQFDISNKSATPVEIGAMGVPMIFNNILTGRNLKEAHEKCSFFDPYIGQDAGYLQVTRLSGLGPALVVVPEGHTPFEAYQLLNEPTRPNQTFEGAFGWMVHTQAYAEDEWKNVNQWNAPTNVSIAPGATVTYGVRFLLSDQIRNIETTLVANHRPVAVGIPGYVLPMDQDARLFLNYAHKVRNLAVEPPGAITINEDKPARNGWKAYTLRGKIWGRTRLTITYDDDSKQAISYYVISPSNGLKTPAIRSIARRQSSAMIGKLISRLRRTAAPGSPAWVTKEDRARGSPRP